MPTVRKSLSTAKEPAKHRARATGKKAANAAVPAVAPIELVRFNSAVRYDEIAALAFQKWLERERTGAPGSSEEDWMKAESELRAMVHHA